MHAPQVKLVVCRFIWNDGSGYISDAMSCLKLCQGEGALISSNSWGGIAKSDFLSKELSAANAAGQLFVVAAGNNGQNMDKTPLYPSSFSDIPNVLSVASSDSNDVISGFSNYGK
jgi:subtilisin family serine protease